MEHIISTEGDQPKDDDKQSQPQQLMEGKIYTKSPNHTERRRNEDYTEMPLRTNPLLTSTQDVLGSFDTASRFSQNSDIKPDVNF